MSFEHVHAVPVPDPYKGKHKGDPKKYVQEVSAVIEQVKAKVEKYICISKNDGLSFSFSFFQNKGISCMIVESIQGVGGQIVYEPGWMTDAFQVVRSAGAVCICDEVQVGFGRVGSSFWAFQSQGVVPDIVTMGKREDLTCRFIILSHCSSQRSEMASR